MGLNDRVSRKRFTSQHAYTIAASTCFERAEALMETNSRKLIQRLEADGWVLIRITGSHHVLAKSGNPNRAVVPHPKRD